MHLYWQSKPFLAVNRLHLNAPSFSTLFSRLSTLCKAHSWLFLPHMSLVAYPWSFVNTPSSPSHSSCHDTSWGGHPMLWLVYSVDVWVKRSSLYVFEAFYEIYLIRWTRKIFKSKLHCVKFLFLNDVLTYHFIFLLAGVVLDLYLTHWCFSLRSKSILKFLYRLLLSSQKLPWNSCSDFSA